MRLITSEEAGGAPLPNYGELSVASLRARLRNLDLTQLRQLAAYEKAHAARAEVMTMFERRIAKLEAEASAERHAEAECGSGGRGAGRGGRGGTGGRRSGGGGGRPSGP